MQDVDSRGRVGAFDAEGCRLVVELADGDALFARGRQVRGDLVFRMDDADVEVSAPVTGAPGTTCQ